MDYNREQVSYNTGKNHRTSVFLQQIWPIVPEVVFYDVAMQQSDASRLVFCSAFPIRSCWRGYDTSITLGTDRVVVLRHVESQISRNGREKDRTRDKDSSGFPLGT